MIWALLPPLVSDYVFSDPIPRLNNTIICQQQACSTRKKVWNDGPGFCPSSLMNDGGFEEHLFCGSSHIALQKKEEVWNNGADLSSWVPWTICTPDQREVHNHYEAPLKGSREASAYFSVPVVFCVFWSQLVLRMICEGVLRERFFLIDQSSVWYVSGAGWSHRRNWNLFVTDWIGNQLSCAPFCYDTEYKSERSITR